MDAARRLEDSLAAPGLTVVRGPAGVGKSTLVRAALPDARWVDASGCADAEAVAVEVARRLEVPILGSAGAALDARIGTAAGALPLVVDGLDALDDSGALEERVARWREEAPTLRVVVTTRRGTGQRTIDVAPLGLGESVAWLRDRVGPGVDDAALEAVARGVEGLPAALVAAASAVRAVGVAEVAALMRATGLPALERLLKRRLEALDTHDRRALVALAAGGDALDAVDAATLVGPGLVDAVGRLREAGLLRAEGFAVLPAVRDHLRRTAADAWAGASAAFVTAAVARVQDALEAWEATGDPTAWQVLVDREPATRAALGLPAAATERVRLLLALEPVVLRRGPYGPYVAALEAAADAPVHDAGLAARAARVHAELLAYAGRVEDAVSAAERAEALARAPRVPPPVLVRTLLCQAWIGLHGRGGGSGAIVLAARQLARALPGTREREHLLAHAALIEAAVHAQAGLPKRTADANHRAARHARAAGDRASEILALRNLGDAWAEAGDTDRARALLSDALALIRTDGDARAECRTLAALGVTTLDAGDPAAALPLLAEAVSQAARLGDRRLEGLIGAYVGVAHALAGDPGPARAALDRAVAIAIRTENTVGQAWALALRACLHATTGDLVRSKADAASARGLAAPTGHDVLLACVGSAEAATGGPTDDRWAALAAGAYDLRLTQRLAARAGAPVPAPAAETAPAGAAGLRVAPDGAWFELQGTRVDLQARGPLRRILAALGAARTTGGVLELEALFAAGWPGERATKVAAGNRVYNALHGLRKLGLEGWVARRDRGWCLDPTRPVEVAAR